MAKEEGDNVWRTIILSCYPDLLPDFLRKGQALRHLKVLSRIQNHRRLADLKDAPTVRQRISRLSQVPKGQNGYFEQFHGFNLAPY